MFLDEPTTGFDPAARRNAWSTMRSLRDLGKTVLLTTHYLDEAQALADRVAIIKDGRILAEGPPASLGAGSSRYLVSYRTADGPRTHETEDPTTLLHELTAAALARGERLEDLSVTRPSLEEVYLELDGRGRDARWTEHVIERGRAGRAAVDERAPARRWSGLAWRQYRLERKMFWRNPSAAFFNFMLPLIFLGFFGALLHDDQDVLQVIVPGIAGMAVMSTTFNALAFNITALRELGILKRIRGTPLPTSAYLAGIFGSAVTNTASQIVIISVAGQRAVRARLAAESAVAHLLRRASASSASPRSASRCRTRSRTSTRRPPT